MVASWCRSVAEPGVFSRLHESDRPGVVSQHLAGRVRSSNDLRPSVTLRRWQLDLTENQIDDAVEYFATK